MAQEVVKDIGAENSKLAQWLTKVDNALNHVGRFSRWLNAVGLGILFLMMCLTFVDVIMRYVFNRPIFGVKEYTEVMLVLVIAFTIAYTYERKGHVSVGLVVDRLAGKSKLILTTIMTIIGTGLLCVVCYTSIEQLIYVIYMGTQHGTAMYIPSAPFQAAIVLGSITLLMLLIRDFVLNIIDCLDFHLKYYYWLPIFGIPILTLVLVVFWVQSELWPLSLPVVGLIGVVVMLILMFAGLPIAFLLMLTGFLMIGHIRGATTAFDVVGAEIFNTSSNYLWSVVGFFVLMGFLCLFARLGEDVYAMIYKWFGHLRGGLTTATIMASTAMAGIVGDNLSVMATMGNIAYPQMKKYKYSDYLSTGTIAAGGTLGPLIPPSMGFIIYGILTEQSIGELFIAGIVPGLILATLFIGTIMIQCHINPSMGPAGPKSFWVDRLVSLKYGGPIAFLFVLIIGGIYLGVFTAIEGGAIGCVGALIIGLVMRRFTRDSFINALVGAGRIIGMIFLIIIGSTIFSRFVAWCNLSGLLLNFTSGLDISPKLLVFFILLMYFILGFIIDILPMLLILVPIFHPIVVALGMDPVWFTVLSVITIQAGVITPPFATALFILKGMLPDVSLSTIFSGVLPFVLATGVGILLLFFIPVLVTWLPGLLY